MPHGTPMAMRGFDAAFPSPLLRAQTIFLPVIGLVPSDELIPGDLVGVNKDSYLILDKLPAE